MAKTAEVVKPKYLIDEKGRKTAVVINLNDYKNLLEFIQLRLNNILAVALLGIVVEIVLVIILGLVINP